MQRTHVPTIDARYWTGITLASIFGTNLGDLYANDSGLGLLGGVPILIALFALVYLVERFDKSRHDAYYWLCIIIMRTGATNIADYMCGRRHMGIDRWQASLGLGLAIAALAWWAVRRDHAQNGPNVRKLLPDTDPPYWVTMLLAGIFGTVLGDACQKALGQWQGAVLLSAALVVVLLLYRKGVVGWIAGYWLVVATARSAGTAIGDFLAENKSLNIGLTNCTLMTGAIFIAILVLWRSRKDVEPVATAA